MDELINPYASPLSPTMLAAEASVAESSPALRRTGIGLSLVYYGILLILLAIVGLFLSVLFLQFGKPPVPGNMSTFLLISGIAGIAVFLGSFTLFAGQVVCLSVPVESRARGLIIATVIFEFASVSHSIVSMIENLLRIQIFPPAAVMAANICGIIGTLLFLLFMRRLSRFIGREDLANKARNVLVFVLVLVALAIVMVVGTAILDDPNFAMIGIVLAIGGLICFVMYVNLINALRKVLLGKETRSKRTMLLGGA